MFEVYAVRGDTGPWSSYIQWRLDRVSAWARCKQAMADPKIVRVLVRPVFFGGAQGSVVWEWKR